MNKVIYVCLLASLTLAGCSSKPKAEATGKVIPVKTLRIAPSAVTGETNYIGTIEESFALSLSFSGMGTVEQILVSEGQKVNKGQLLATLNPATAQNAVDAAKASLRQAQDAYDRLSKLHNSGSLPDIKFVEVETGLQQAKSMLAMAEKNLGDCRLYAPGSGIVAVRNIEPGENVIPGATALKLITVDRMDVKIAVPENEISRIVPKQEAVVEVTALGGERFEGKIETTGISAHPLTHAYEVKIRIDNPQGRLMPGMVCKVRLKQPDREAGIVIPNRAVQIAPDGSRFVWLASDGVARRCSVTTGDLKGKGVSIENGLKDGDRLIIEGGSKVSDGMKINVLN
jgi:RND family efflux transporter MFP subunit